MQNQRRTRLTVYESVRKLHLRRHVSGQHLYRAGQSSDPDQKYIGITRGARGQFSERFHDYLCSTVQ